MNRLQTGMRGAFGKPQGTVARVHIGQPIMSVRSADRYKAQVIEALRRAKFKFPGRQKVSKSMTHFFFIIITCCTMCVPCVSTTTQEHKHASKPFQFDIRLIYLLTFISFGFVLCWCRFSFRKNGDSRNSIAHVMRSSVMRVAWHKTVAMSNTDQSMVQWLHGKRFKPKSITVSHFPVKSVSPFTWFECHNICSLITRIQWFKKRSETNKQQQQQKREIKWSFYHTQSSMHYFFILDSLIHI